MTMPAGGFACDWEATNLRGGGQSCQFREMSRTVSAGEETAQRPFPTRCFLQDSSRTQLPTDEISQLSFEGELK